MNKLAASFAVAGLASWGLVGVAMLWLDTSPNNEAFHHETRVRYPGEETTARAACGERKVMYWWIETPRRSGVTMHVYCSGRIEKIVELRP